MSYMPCKNCQHLCATAHLNHVKEPLCDPYAVNTDPVASTVMPCGRCLQMCALLERAGVEDSLCAAYPSAAVHASIVGPSDLGQLDPASHAKSAAFSAKVVGGGCDVVFPR
jgi:hypothetical protein